MLVTFHLGTLLQGFFSSAYKKNYTKNVDETYFVINMDNGKTLGFRGDEKVKDIKIVFDREATMMVVEVSRGV